MVFIYQKKSIRYLFIYQKKSIRLLSYTKKNQSDAFHIPKKINSMDFIYQKNQSTVFDIPKKINSSDNCQKYIEIHRNTKRSGDHLNPTRIHFDPNRFPYDLYTFYIGFQYILWKFDKKNLQICNFWRKYVIFKPFHLVLIQIDSLMIYIGFWHILIFVGKICNFWRKYAISNRFIWF